MYEKEKTIAIIPARSGSKGIKNKNIFEIKGFPLIAYSIAAAKLTKGIERIIVSTDSAEYADIARKYGAEVPFLRPTEISRSDSRDIEYLQHTLKSLFHLERKMPEYVVLLRPTTPVRSPLLIEKAMLQIMDNKLATAVVSVHPILDCPYKWMTISGAGYLESPFSEMEPDDVNLPRQSFKKVYEPNGYVDVLRSRIICEDGAVYGKKAIPFFTRNGVVDIDTIDDLKRLNLNSRDGVALFRYLTKQNEKH